MRNYIFILWAILLIISSCSSKNTIHEDKGLLNINLDTLADNENIKIKKVKYIPLETKDDCLISGISKIIYKYNKFYIWDIVSKSIFVFNENGTLLRKIDAVGNGPGEYVDMYGMDVDNEGNIWTSDFPSQKLIRYSENPEKKAEEIRTGEQFLYFTVADSGYFYFCDVHHQGILDVRLEQYDIRNGEIKIIMKNKDGLRIQSRSSDYFFRSQEKIYYYNRFQPYIYQITAGHVEPAIKINTQSMPSDEVLEKWAKEGPYATMDNRYMCDVYACYETDLYMLIFFRTQIPSYVIIDKRNNTVYKMKFFNEIDFNGKMNDIYSAGKDYFVSYYMPTKDNLKYLLSEENDVINKNRLNELTEDSNPILVLFTFDTD